MTASGSSVADGPAGCWYLYLVRTAAGALYTGISTDPARRVDEHAGSPRGARALRGRGPLQLAWQHPVGSRSLALRAEAAVKRLPRTRKEALLSGLLALEQVLPALAGAARLGGGCAGPVPAAAAAAETDERADSALRGDAERSEAT